MTEARAAPGKLFVVATPIGNLGDLSPRAREVLAAAEIIAAEDTRRLRGLLSTIPAETQVIAYHEHNESERAAELVERLERGSSVALVSDAGTPLVSDPGWRLVRAAHAAGVAVVPIPGPSAALAALAASGLPTDRFVFEGFLPRRAGARAERLAELKHERRTLVFFEAVHRIEATLAALADAFGADRPAALARELTKLHEQIVPRPLGELCAALGGEIPLLGEFVLVVGGAETPRPAEHTRAAEIYELLVAELPASAALRLTAAITRVPRNELYRLVRT